MGGIVCLCLVRGVLLDEVFKLRRLVVGQLLELYTMSSHCCRNRSGFVSYFQIRNGFHRYLFQIKTIISQ